MVAVVVTRDARIMEPVALAVAPVGGMACPTITIVPVAAGRSRQAAQPDLVAALQASWGWAAVSPNITWPAAVVVTMGVVPLTQQVEAEGPVTLAA